jgi:hypothetical protein
VLSVGGVGGVLPLGGVGGVPPLGGVGGVPPLGVVDGEPIWISPDIIWSRSASGIPKSSAILLSVSSSTVTWRTILKVFFLTSPDIGSSDALDRYGLSWAREREPGEVSIHFQSS